MNNYLAYSWGGKEHTIRKAPPGANTVCTHQIYGLDCSGFIYQLFKKGGVDIAPGNADRQRKPENIKNAILKNLESHFF